MTARRLLILGSLLIVAALVVAVLAGQSPSRTPLTATFAGVSLKIELATTTAAQERGLGGRPAVPSDYGMLFVFPQDGRYGFWMKDMEVPLDIFWLDDKGQVVTIAADVATSTYPGAFFPSAPARYVLETAAGFAKAHDVATGTPLTLRGVIPVSK